MSIRTLLALALMLAAGTEATQEHGHIRSDDSMAMVLSANALEEADDSCDATNGQGCQRQLTEQDERRQQAPPEFVPTHEWQDILPNQAIPPGLYIRVNLETGKKEAKLLD
uniref:RxLR effector protein n=2 Tax=Phytophthora ramorum TaxID=164328 RepID=H3GCC0_PHYRM